MFLLENKIQKKPDKISFKQLSESYFKKPPPQKLFQSSQKQHYKTQLYSSTAQLNQNLNQNYYNANNVKGNKNFQQNNNNDEQLYSALPKPYVSDFQQESQRNVQQLAKNPNAQLISSTWDVRHLDKFLEQSIYSNKNQNQMIYNQPSSSNQNHVYFKNQNFQSLNDLEQQFKNAKLIDINSQQFDENQSTTHFKLPNATSNANASLFQQQFQQQKQQQLQQENSQQLQQQVSQNNFISTQNSNLSQAQRVQKSMSQDTNKRLQIQKILNIKKKKQKGERLVGSSQQQYRSMSQKSKKNDLSLNNIEEENKKLVDFPNNYTKLNMLVTLHQEKIPQAETYYNTNFMIEKPQDLQKTQCYQYNPQDVSRLQTPSFARKELQDVKENQIKLKQWRQNFFEANKKYRVHKSAYKSGIMGVDNPLNPHTQLYKQEHNQIVECQKGKDFINEKFRQNVKKHTLHFIMTDGNQASFNPLTNTLFPSSQENQEQNLQAQPLSYNQQQQYNQTIKIQFGNFWSVKNKVREPFMQKFEKTGYRLFGAKPDKYNISRAQNIINNEVMKKPDGYNILSNEKFNIQLKQDRGLLDSKENQFLN